MNIKNCTNLELGNQLTSLLSIDAMYELDDEQHKELNAIEEEISFRVATGQWY